ncbi:MAG: glycosyltransferase family 4 protein [Leptospirillia bacterium]
MPLPPPLDGLHDTSVTFINRVYPPVPGATGELLRQLAEELAATGTRVTVVTSRPSDDLPEHEMSRGVRVERVAGIPFHRSGHLRRAVSYLSLFPAMAIRALGGPRPDVIITMSDPPLLSVMGVVMSRLLGASSMHWAQDVYPQLAAELGVINREGITYRTLNRISSWALARHDKVICVGRCMEERLRKNGARALAVVPNWPAPEVHPVAGKNNAFLSREGLSGSRVVMYSGNFGLAHDFSTIIDAAERLRDSRPDIQFLCVGEGPKKSWVADQVRDRKLVNMRLMPFQSRQNLSSSLGAADIHLATMEPNLSGLVVPSKVYGVLAAGRPCIFLGPEDSEVARLISEKNCGRVLPRPSGSRLATTIEQLLEDGPALRKMGSRAIEAVAGSGASVAARQFHTILSEIPFRKLPNFRSKTSN